MKKLLSLVLAAMMLFSLSAVAMAEDEAGFDEFELGVEGEQDVGFMTMSMVYFQPVDMAPVDQATAKENTDLHIEVDLSWENAMMYHPYTFSEVKGLYSAVGTTLRAIPGPELLLRLAKPVVRPASWHHLS